MSPDRFQEITSKYASLRIGVVGDFCLDRYLEIDPTKQETSIETGLPVHNVVNVRSQPGAAGTILNNLVALGIGEIYPVGFAGEDGEGFELRATLQNQRGVRLDHFWQTDQRRTFTYCKPLVVSAGKPPVELNRFDSKNWTPTPALLQGRLIDSAANVAADSDAIILMDQVGLPETGVITSKLLEAVSCIVSALAGCPDPAQLEELKAVAAVLARKQVRHVFVTLSERGILGASPEGRVEHVPALPVRGPIDIVGAGDAVTANLTAALAAGATLREVMEIAMAAAAIVIHELGTTGTASVNQIRSVLESVAPY